MDFLSSLSVQEAKARQLAGLLRNHLAGPQRPRIEANWREDPGLEKAMELDWHED